MQVPSSTPHASHQEDILVIGGGLIGLCTAFSLMRRGHAVTVVERHDLGAGAARGNAGEITPLSALPMPAPGMVRELVRGVLSKRHYLSIDPFAIPGLTGFGLGFLGNANAKRLARNTKALDQLVRGAFDAFDSYAADGVQARGGGTGFLYTHSDPTVAAAFRSGLVARAEALNMPHPEPLHTGSELRERYQILTDAVQVGFLAQHERFLDPGMFADDLAAALVAGGATLRTRHEVIGLDLAGRRPTVLVRAVGGNAPIERLTGSKVVVASGAWTSSLVAHGGGRYRRLVVAPGRGYSFSVQPEALPNHLIGALDRRTVAIPMNGRLRVVGLMDFGGGADRFEPHRVQHLADQASTFLRGIDWSARTEEWVGPRPMTPDGLPVIGRLPADARVIVATGHNMHGLSLGPVTGELVTALVEDRAMRIGDAEVDARPFSLTGR